MWWALTLACLIQLLQNLFPMNLCSSLMTAYCWEKHVVCLRARSSCGACRCFPPLRSSIDPQWLCRGARWKPLTVIYGMSSPGEPDEHLPLVRYLWVLNTDPHLKSRGSIKHGWIFFKFITNSVNILLIKIHGATHKLLKLKYSE